MGCRVVRVDCEAMRTVGQMGNVIKLNQSSREEPETTHETSARNKFSSRLHRIYLPCAMVQLLPGLSSFGNWERSQRCDIKNFTFGLSTQCATLKFFFFLSSAISHPHLPEKKVNLGIHSQRNKSNIPWNTWLAKQGRLMSFVHTMYLEVL